MRQAGYGWQYDIAVRMMVESYPPDESMQWDETTHHNIPMRKGPKERLVVILGRGIIS